MSEVSISSVWDRLRMEGGGCWMEGVNVDLCSRGITVEAERQCANDIRPSKALVHILVIKNDAAMFGMLLFVDPPAVGWLSTWFVGGGGRYMIRLG